MATRIDITQLIGKQFGLLTVISEAEPRIDKRGHKHKRVLCQCECGNTTLAEVRHLGQGQRVACGCTRKLVNRTHGHTAGGHSLTYRSWYQMRHRCGPSAKGKERELYYDRGIRVCDRWSVFANFLEDMGPRPSLSHSIDRIDVNGPYASFNCRWSTAKEQANNTRRNRHIKVANVTYTVSRAAEVLGVNDSTLRERLRRGWCDTCATTIGVGEGACTHR